MISTLKKTIAIAFPVLIFLISCTSSFIHKQPSDLKVEDQIDPIGIGDTTPEFSWITEDYESDQIQKAFQILVASSIDLLDENIADLWNSGKIKNNNSAYITYTGKSLTSRGTYYWKVRTWNNKGRPSLWSHHAKFEMGLLSNEDWDAKWIWRENSGIGSDYCYFRKIIDLPDKPILRARIYVSSCHHHELYINGEITGKGPNFEYPDKQLYQTFDIGSSLHPGQPNTIGLLAVHWGKGGQGRPAGSEGLIVKAILEFNDGTSLNMSSDETWKVHQAEWVKTDTYRNGENIPCDYIDGRLHPVGWNLSDFNDSKWGNAIEIGSHPVTPWINTLIAQETSIMEYEIRPAKINKLGKGHFVADFGKVYSGTPKISFSDGITGTNIRVKADYRDLEDGTLKGFSQNTKLDYEYILRGGNEIFRPLWYVGFRYLEVENAPASFDGSSITMIVRHNTVDATQSSFDCSDTTITAIWELGKRSAMMASHEEFVDTPTREQGQFTYDGFLTSGAIMKCFLERDLSQQALKQFAYSQKRYHSETGKVNAAYPNNDGKRDIQDWTQAFILWAWEYYMQTGDLEQIEDIFENLLNIAKYNKSSENKQTGLIDFGSLPSIQRGSLRYKTGIVDWIDSYDYDLLTSQRTVLSINGYLNYLYLSKLAQELGKKEVHDTLQKYADDILSSINSYLWDDNRKAYIDGLYENGTRSSSASQQTNAMMLALSLIKNEQEARSMEIVKQAGHSTGVLLIRYLIQAFGENGEDDALYEFLTNPEGRNYAYILSKGATFCWEDWRLFVDVFSESHGYGSYGAVCAIQDYILGVKPLKPQYSHIRIKPCLTGKLTFAKGKVPTQRGPVNVGWKNNDDETFAMDVKIPFNIIADIYVPVKESSTVLVNGLKKKGKTSGKYILYADMRPGEYTFISQ